MAKWVLPNLLPFVLNDITKWNEVALAGDDGAVRFDGHAYSAGATAFYSQFELQRVENAVFRGCVPCELHSEFLSVISYLG